MSRSYTYHCIGHGKRDEKGWQRIFTAMNRLEVIQETAKAEADGDPVAYWFPQTRVGCRVLGHGDDSYFGVQAKDIPRLKTVECPKCRGKGCQICNWAGFTTKAHLKKYRPWQLEPEARE